MAIGEFDLIDQYFRVPGEQLLRGRSDVALGIGDDAALLNVPAGRQLVAALDTLVEGRHFPVGSPAESIGHRALAVNLSDLAAMGADPAWFLLALTLPQADEQFLAAFAHGMLTLAREHGIALVGGDTTAGPLSASVQALGWVPEGEALRRSGGKPGDLLFVSGTPGEAAIGLALEMGSAGIQTLDGEQAALLRHRFLYPAPRVALGRLLRGWASACIDVSDGLAADALKLATASSCGARLDVEKLPLSPALCAAAGAAGAVRAALAGGDDYELCFTVPAARLTGFLARMTNVKCQVTCVGMLEENRGLRIFERAAQIDFDAHGFDHFMTAK